MDSTEGLVGRRTFLQAAALGGAVAVAGAVASGVAHAAMPSGAHGRRRLDQEAIDAAAAALEPDLIELRRSIHEHPEAAGDERRTSALVARRLRAAGLAVTTGVGGHGVVGLLRGSHPGRTVAYRADMDAVPPGGTVGGVTDVAHLCGHDVHTTVGVGIAEVLAGMRSRLGGTVAFVFQPAEENLAGARAMLDDGVLRRTGAREIHALHCAPAPVGTLAVTPGLGMPGLDDAVATVTGPDAAERAEALAAEIAALSTVAYPRTLPEMEQLLADLQTPGGPLATFVNVQDTVLLPGDGSVTVDVSYRCWPEERYLEVRDRIRALAARHGARVEFPSAPFPALVCPEREAYALQRHLRRVLDPEHTARMHAVIPFNGEDFSLFARRVPVTYTFLGVRAPGALITTAFPHHVDFDPDERAIGVGVRAMAGWLAMRARAPR